MADIVMPQLGESVTEGTITRWFKAVGDSVTEDEPLFEVSTDKVDTEVPAPASGVLSEIRVQEGDTVDVGTVLAVLGDGSASAAVAPGSGPTAEAPLDAAPAPPVPAPAPPPDLPVTAPPVSVPPVSAVPTPPLVPPVAPERPTQSAPPSVAAADGGVSTGDAVLLSPLVRRLVEEHAVDVAQITGTGVGGRITRDDVLSVLDDRAASAPAATGSTVGAAPPMAPASVPPAPSPQPPVPVAPSGRSTPAPPRGSHLRPGSGDTVEPLNKIRRMTGEHMVMSKATSPHAITMVEVDYEAVERVRRVEREGFRVDEGISLTYLPFVCRAVVDALREFPHMNASVADGSLVVHNDVNLAIAVDLDYEGLLAPVIVDAHEKRLRAIAHEISDLATRARSKQLGPDELTDGTFTISNSGSYGTAMVIPIISQPQVAILSTDGVSRRPVVLADSFGNETIGIHSVGNLTLSWDHRAFDGAYAAAFMARLKEIVETRDWAAEL